MDSSALDILVTPDFLPGSIVIKYTKNGTLVGTCIWLNNALFQCTIPECEFYCDYESVKPSHGVVVICGVVVVQFDSRENSTVPFLVADRRKRVLYYSSDRDVARTNHASIVDLDSDGTRWEGDTVGGDPGGGFCMTATITFFMKAFKWSTLVFATALCTTATYREWSTAERCSTESGGVRA